MAKSKKPVTKNTKATASDAAGADKPKDDPKPATQKTDVKAEAAKPDAKVAEAAKPAADKASDAKKPEGKKPEDKKAEPSKPAVAEKSSAGAAASKAADTKVSKPDSGQEKSTKPEPEKKPAAPVKAEAPKVEKAEPAPKPAPTPAPQQQRSVFWPMVFGGVIAAILGYIAAEADVFGLKAPAEDLRPAIAAQEEQNAAQEARIAALENVEPAPEVDLSAVDALTEQAAALATQLADIDARLTVVEKQPISGGGSEAAVAAYERELAKLQASVEEQRAEIEGLLDNALSVEQATAEAARAAKLQAALTEITTAIGAGQPFAEHVGSLSENGMSDVPAALSDVAADGVATLANLQGRFADSARASLSAARASGEDGEEAGVGSFLRRQLGARSVAPREGDDPDAVLSRAEAAVRDGQLAGALQELDTLPAAAKDAMQDWLTDAQARQDALGAIQDLSQSLTAN